MPEVVKVSTVETDQKLLSAIQNYFQKGQYNEITQAIGMHSILFQSEHMLEDQEAMYRSVLSMIKNRIAGKLGKQYAAWYREFPKILDRIVSGGQIVTDKSSTEVIASHRAAFGAFASVDHFFFWALDDRRLTLDQIVKYLEKTTESVRNR
jgi:hypothetical protein